MEISQIFHISPYSFTACASFAATAHIPARSTLVPPIPAISRVGCQRTGSILAAADLDEALDVGDFAGHVGGICLTGFGRVILEALNRCSRWPSFDFTVRRVPR